MADATDGHMGNTWSKLLGRKVVQWGLAYAAGARGCCCRCSGSPRTRSSGPPSQSGFEEHLTENRFTEKWGRRWQGQDVWFCVMCLNLGLKLWVDTRVFWGHVKASDIRAEYLEVLALKQQLAAAGVKVEEEVAV